MTVYYNACLDLTGRSVVLVGGGVIAYQKLTPLLEAGAKVRVIAPEVTPEIAALADEGAISLDRREYRHGDLADCILAITATDDHEVNEAATAEGTERNIFLNAVDKPPYCSFIVPAIVRRGPLTLAISTSGLSPAFSKRVRQRLERLFPPSYGQAVQLYNRARNRINAQAPERRESLWEEMFALDLPDIIHTRGLPEAEHLLEQWMASRLSE